MIAYISVEMSPKEWSKNTFGFARAEVSKTKLILCWFKYRVIQETVFYNLPLAYIKIK